MRIRLCCMAIGYLFGLFQTALIVGRARGVDIRSVGSGNAGTTNTLRVMGARAGLLVLLGDILKCVLAILLTDALFGAAHPEIRCLLKAYTGLGVILGHDYPFYTRFKGGKGIAATCGFLIAFHWSFIPAFLIAFLVPFAATHYVSLGSLMINVCMLVLMVIEGQAGVFGMTQNRLNELYLVAALLAALAFYQHRGNIAKLLQGRERKTYVFHKNKID